jgi:hypothetical protein
MRTLASLLLDAVTRDTRLRGRAFGIRNRWTAASCLINRSEGSSTRRDGPAGM